MVTDVRPIPAPEPLVATGKRHVIDDSAILDAIRGIPVRHPVVGLAVGVVRDGRLDLFHGHGVADIASGRSITEGTGFRIASITKTMTAIAIMQLVEEGLIDLDSPANKYLRSFRLVAANPAWRSATLRDLLTHSAGLPETPRALDALRPDWGETVPADAPLPTLATLYRGRLRVGAEPGTRFIYGNHSPATLGQIVEDVSGRPLHAWFRERIFEPLGMGDTDLRRTDAVRRRLATGYSVGGGGTTLVPPREYITAGAASVYSTPRDMARYVAALLGGGANDHGRVLRPETLATMFEPHYMTDPRLAGMGLGFMRLDLAGRIAPEHQGMMPGFHSQMTFLPDAGVGVIAFTNGAKDPSLWLPAEVATVVRQLAGLPPDRIRTDVPHRPDVWNDLVGWYALDAGLNDIRVRAVMGLGVEVFVRAGALAIRFLAPIPPLLAGFPLHPDDPADPYAFRMDMRDVGMATSRVVFTHEPGTRTTAAVHVDMMPLMLRKQPQSTNPRRWAMAAMAGLAVAYGARRARARPREQARRACAASVRRP
jgi:CubicO group peptidase (beta-lactamase class C family)